MKHILLITALTLGFLAWQYDTASEHDVFFERTNQ